MISFLKSSIIAISLVALSASAEPETISLEQLVSALVRNNPDIQAAESRYEAAQVRPSQMRTLPDPVLSFVSRNGSGNPAPFTELGKDPLSSIGLMWEQEFPFPGKLRLSGEMAQKEADAAKVDIETVRWKVISNLKEAYYEYFRVDRSIQILNDSLKLLKHFEEIARARYGVGEGIQQDVLRSQLEISIMDQRITSMQQERATAAAEINRLLNRPVDSPLPNPAEVTQTKFVLPAETLESEFITDAPQIRSGEAMVSREQKNLELAKKQFRPDFMTSVEYATSPNFPDMWEIEFGLRIPIFYKTKQAYGVAEASHNLTRTQKELRSMQLEIAFSIRNQFLQIQASEKLLRLYDQAVLPQSNLALESSLATYQVGKSDFLTTMSNFMTLLEYRMNRYAELSRHETAIARLERILGRPVAAVSQAKGESHHE
ncbi:TolC family protein [bacterium]|nr:TolC family protein [bacterium]